VSTAGATVPGSSVVVFHQTFMAAGSDPDTFDKGAQPPKGNKIRGDWDLKRAVEWLKAVKAATGAPDDQGVFVEEIASPLVGANAANNLFFRDFITQIEEVSKKIGGDAGQKLTPAKLTAPWSKLPPGHTLVLLIHGTTATTDTGRKVGGIKLWDDHTDNPKHNIALDEFDLEHMIIDKDEVKADPKFDDNERAEERAPLVQALRVAPFQRIVLLACGTANRLKTFAPALARFTKKVVYHNNPHPVFLDFVKPNIDPRVHVGTGEEESTTATGKAWVPTDPAPKLKTKKDTFLPGTMEIETPP
jgi:hypothetical protein